MKIFSFLFLMLIASFSYKAIANTSSISVESKLIVPIHDTNKGVDYLLFQVYTTIENNTLYIRVYTNDYLPQSVNLLFTVNMYNDNSGVADNTRTLAVQMGKGTAYGLMSYPCGSSYIAASSTLESMSPSSISGYIMGFDYYHYNM